MDQEKATPEAEAGISLRGRIGNFAARLLAWSMATRLRKVVSSVAGLLALGLVFAAWSYFGQMALDPVEAQEIEAALAALDRGDIGEAKSLVGQMQNKPATEELLAGALFVLGAVKGHEADEETSADRRRAVHEIAARYLQKARGLGLGDDQHLRAAYLLGRSLVLSGQWEAAVLPLKEAVRGEVQPVFAAHQLLVDALLALPEADLEAALGHNAQVLAAADLPAADRDRAWLISAGILMRLKRHDEVRAALEHIGPEGPQEAGRKALLAQIEVEEAESLPPDAPERSQKLTYAAECLQQVLQLDRPGGSLSRQAELWLARCLELRDDLPAARAEYERIGLTYPNTSEGLAAALAAADAFRKEGQFDRALNGYRTVLRGMTVEAAHDNPLVSHAEIKRRLSDVYQQCVDQELFSEAMTLVDLFEPVFDRTSCVEMRCKTLQQWAARELSQSHESDPAQAAATIRQGRAHLRAAGQAYEDLARLRFATRHFVDDLWSAAECNFQGHSFSNAERLYLEYLHHESQRRNALGLLRLGESRLAAGYYEKAVSAFEECAELFPQDAVVHQARLGCSRALEQMGQVAEAEQLLLDNLEGDSLTPASPEWRDSLFALGRLLYEAGRHDEAIDRLQEAVKRYPDAADALSAKYTIARAYHGSAEGPAKRLEAAVTDNERQSARAALTDKLTKAYEYYQQVQRQITLGEHTASDGYDRALLRNCYLMQGAVLVEMKRFDDAIQAYGNVITTYPQDPISLESYVQVANCWRRLNQPVKARVTLDQARMVLNGLPKDVDYLASTNFSRQQWEGLLKQMSSW